MNYGIDVDDFTPGIYHLDLNINSRRYRSHESLSKIHPGKKTSNAGNLTDMQQKSHERDLTLRYEALCNDLSDTDVPDSESTLVFLGTLASHLGKFKAATQHFEDVLKKNATNLNAIAGLVHVCSQNPTTQERAAKCKKSIADLLGRSEIDATPDELSYRLACCYADQAYALAYDVGLTSFEERMDRLVSATEYYDRALCVGDSTISLDERRRWYLSLAEVLLCKDDVMVKQGDDESLRLSGFNRAISILNDVSKSESTYMQAVAWTYLGVCLERQSSFETTPMSVHDCGFTTSEPIDCYSKSIEIAEKSPAVLNRLAKIFQSSQKYELALGAVDMSIGLSPKAIENFAAYRIRARIRMELYNRDLIKCKMGHGSIPDREMLEMARDDLEKNIRVKNDDLFTMIDIGQVYYYIGVDAFKETFVVDEECVNSALVYFSKALLCGIGSSIPQLQLMRGKCLKLKGEDRNALECFKKSIELEKEGCNNAQPFRLLMETLLVWFPTVEENRQIPVIRDVDRWLQSAQEKYTKPALALEIRALSSSFTNELLDLCKLTTRAGKLTLAKLCLSPFVSAKETTGIKSSSADVMR